MNRSKVIKVNSDVIKFDNGIIIESEHESDCCEKHFLSFEDLTIEDFEGLEFDLTSENFFRKIEDYGIALIPLQGHPVKIPGYGFNNGYYSTNLKLVITNNKGFRKEFDITECQEISD